MTDQIPGVIVGGGVAIVSGCAHDRTARQERMASAEPSLLGFEGDPSTQRDQPRDRHVGDLGRTLDRRDQRGMGAVPRYFRGWNAARHEAALIAPQTELQLLAQLDRDLDRVLEAAILKRWDPSDFRMQRARLGELAFQYVRAARRTANEGSADLPSIWSLASDLDEAARRPGQPTQGGDPRAS